MIVAMLLAALGAWAISRDEVAAGVGCVVWGCVYALWWWRSRRSAAEPVGAVGGMFLPAVAACALAGLVIVVIQRMPAISPFATLLAERSPSIPSLSTLLVALPPVLLSGLVLLLARRRSNHVE